MDYKELIKNRRSIRIFKEQPVPTEVLQEIIKESTLAPSSGNSQPWKLVIVNNKSIMRRISDESKKNLLARIKANPADYISKYESTLRNEQFNVFYNAPALIIIAGQRSHPMLLVDCALFAGYLMNAAAARGLGTCWVNLGSDLRSTDLLEELGITGDIKIVAPVIIGHPVSIPEAAKREEPAILKTIH
jgi:nitroreductase